MKAIEFDTGDVSLSVNGGGSISFNPTDINFVQRLFEVFEILDKKQEQYKQGSEDMTDYRAIFELSQQRDQEMRELINSAFRDDVCTVAFGDRSVYAMAGGLPIWCNFLLSVIEFIDASIISEQKKTNPRIAKYTAKYRK